MEALPVNYVGLVAVFLIFGLPVIAVVMVFWSSMHKNTKDKEIRQLIIENHIDSETAKLLIDEPKKAKKPSHKEYLFLAHHCFRSRHRNVMLFPC